MSSILRLILVVFLVTGIIGFSYAQQTIKPINLITAISATLKNNKTIHNAKIDEQIAQNNFQQTNSIFLPQVNFSFTGLSTNNPLNAFGFKLQERTINQSDFNPELLNHPINTADFTTKFELHQPILNIDMIYERKSAAAVVDIYRYKCQRTAEYLVFEVHKTILQLQLSYKAVSVLEEALQTSKSVYTFTNNHFLQGLIAKSDVLNAEVHIEEIETNLEKAHSSISNLSDYLSLMMGEPTGNIYIITDSFPNEAVTLPYNKINARRADFMAMQKSIDAANLIIESSKMSFLPKLNGFANYQYNDNQPLGFGANAYLVGLELSWEVFNGGRIRNSISSQILEKEKLTENLAQQMEQSQVELNKAYKDYEDAAYEITQKKTAVKQSEEALRIIQNRFEQGLVQTTEVFLTASQLSQQKFALAEAEFTQSISLAYIKFLTTINN